MAGISIAQLGLDEAELAAQKPAPEIAAAAAGTPTKVGTAAAAAAADGAAAATSAAATTTTPTTASSSSSSPYDDEGNMYVADMDPHGAGPRNLSPPPSPSIPPSLILKKIINDLIAKIRDYGQI